eukprot:207864_1
MSSHEASGPESLETEPFSPPKDRMECLSVAVSAVERSTRSKSKKRRPRKQTGKLKTTAAGFEEKWFNCNLCGNFKRVPLRGVNGHKVQHNCTAASQCVYIIGKAYSADQKGRNADQVVVRGKREPAVYNYVAPEGGNSSSHSQDSQSSRSKRAELRRQKKRERSDEDDDALRSFSPTRSSSRSVSRGRSVVANVYDSPLATALSSAHKKQQRLDLDEKYSTRKKRRKMSSSEENDASHRLTSDSGRSSSLSPARSRSPSPARSQSPVRSRQRSRRLSARSRSRSGERVFPR